MADMTIEGVRQKFPQYNDLSDEQLAQGIHKKYYPDMAFEDFSKKIGYSAKPNRVMSEEEKGILKGIGETQEFGKGFGSGVAQMFTGAGELLPQEYGGKASAEATKYLKGVGDPRAQKVGELGASIIPFGAAESLATKGLTGLRGALKIPETSTLFRGAEAVVPGAFGGGVTGEIQPTGIVDEEKRMKKKREEATKEAAIGGVVGGAAEALPAIGRTIKTAVLPEKTVAEKFATKAEGPTDIGVKIESNVLDTLKDSMKQRKEQAEQLFNNFYAKVEPYQEAMRNEYAARVREYALKNEGSLTEEQLKLIRDSLKRMENPSKQVSGSEIYSNAKGMDFERRRLSDLADKPQEGYDSLAIQTAKDLEKLMEGVLNAPKGANFNNVLKEYAKLSEPINLAETAFGQKVTKRAGDYISDLPKFERKDLVDQAFKSRDRVEAFRRLTGNNEQFVQEIARDKLALDLKGKSTSKDIRDVINKNIDWLSTPQMKDTVLKDLLNLESSLRSGQRAKMGAAGASILALGSGIPSAISKIGSFLSGEK